ncbi:mitotic-spindle organizing gamma-tubulin ring associated-domain-containing protein [Sporodiniella umbellata]|nr:mitotic-spindle organizing gamma-tubulin ring associated-domain-containing protein [Sporodiniella umbellata]
MEQPRNREVKETIDILHEMATILNTGLDRDAVALCISLCERGANPEALATIVRDLQERQANQKHNDL